MPTVSLNSLVLSRGGWSPNIPPNTKASILLASDV